MKIFQIVSIYTNHPGADPIVKVLNTSIDPDIGHKQFLAAVDVELGDGWQYASSNSPIGSWRSSPFVTQVSLEIAEDLNNPSVVICKLISQ